MALSQTVAETQFTEQFKKSLESRSADSLLGLREEAFDYFSENGYPTPRNEDWKYTNVAPVGTVDWVVKPVGASTSAAAKDVNAIIRRFRFDRNGFTALNIAFSESMVLRIPRETAVEQPIEIKIAAENGSAVFPHIVIIAEAGSKATIVETYEGIGTYFTNTAVQVIVEDNAGLTHFRVQKESADAFHIGTTEVELRRGSVYDSTNINLGGALSRHDIDLKFTEEGSEAVVDGLYMLNGSQHSDTHSVIDHTVPNCTSHQNYKGVLNDRSRAVFNGKVFVRENAHGTNAQQSNKNLLLSNEARVDTKPQLEIFNDDVKCSHGATVGQLEDEELFYLLTRGLPEPLARNLLTYGFAEEIINKIDIESIKAELDAAVLNRLQARLEG